MANMCNACWSQEHQDCAGYYTVADKLTNCDCNNIQHQKANMPQLVQRKPEKLGAMLFYGGEENAEAILRWMRKDGVNGNHRTDGPMGEHIVYRDSSATKIALAGQYILRPSSCIFFNTSAESFHKFYEAPVF